MHVRVVAFALVLSACGAKSDPEPFRGGPLTKEECAAHPSCSANIGAKPCSSGECFALDGCDTPICIDSDAACIAICGTRQCAVLESYPAQIACTPG